MKLKLNDQLHVSAVQSDTLRPGQEIEVSDALGEELLAKHPGKFDPVLAGEKAAQEPHNKAAPAHAGKAAKGAKAPQKKGD